MTYNSDNYENILALSVGSNLGDRLSNLQQARLACENSFGKSCLFSSIVETNALLPENAPKSWDIPYLNAVILFDNITLNPLEILEIIQKLEINCGRQKTSERWAPRIIDIDILMYGNLILDLPQLKIPHYDLANRGFFLKPLSELLPDWRIPTSLNGVSVNFGGKSVLELLSRMADIVCYAEDW